MASSWTGYLTILSRFVLASTFLLAGITKLRRRVEFEKAISNYKITPARFSRPIAVWLPRFELLCGILLGFGVAIAATAVALLAGLSAFTLAIGVNLVKGRELDCGCFGPSRNRITWLTVVRNSILVLGAALLAVAPGQPLSISLFAAKQASARAATTGDAVAMLVVSTLVVLFSLLVGQVRRFQIAVLGYREAETAK